MGSEKSDLKILKMVIWEKELHEQSSRKKRMSVVFHSEDMKPETTEKLKNHILFEHRLWKVRFENGDHLIHLTNLQAEFSKRTWFLWRLSLHLLKNHILFGNRLWKVRFGDGDLRKPPSQAEFSKGMWFLRRLRLNLLKNHILFGNRPWNVRFENIDSRKWFENTIFTIPSRAELSKGTWFLRRLSLNLLKNLIHSFFLEIGSEKSDLKMVISENHFHKQNCQKKCGFSGYSAWIYSKNKFLLRILLMKVLKVVFSNQSNQHFQIWLFQSGLSKRMCFLSWFRLNLIQNKDNFTKELSKIQKHQRQ